jgi:uncharacterized protein YqeY
MASALLERLLADIKQAMKNRETDKLTALRSLHAQVKDATVNVGKEESDELVATVVAKAIKQRRDSVEQYRSGGREDLAGKEEQELGWLEIYLPEQLSEEAIEKLVRSAIEASGAAGKSDMGKVMKVLMPEVKGKADGKLVNQIVQRLLA